MKRIWTKAGAPPLDEVWENLIAPRVFAVSSTNRLVSLLQTDTRDVRDKGALGTALVTHLDRQHLPRYQWTACDGRGRSRFLVYSYSLSSTNGWPS